MATGFVGALRNQGGTLYAVIQSEAEARFARRSLGIFESVGSIALHVIGFAALRYATGAPTHHGMPMVPFLLCSIFMYWTFKTTIRASAGFVSGKPRYTHMPRVTQLDVMFAKAIVNFIIYITLAYIAFVFVYLIGLSEWIHQPGVVFLVILVAWFWGFTIGLMLGALFTVAPFLRTFFGVLIRVLMYVGGVFFVYPEVEYSLRPFVVYNPFFHLSEAIHQAYFRSYLSPILDWGFILKSVAVTTLLGLALERVCRPFYERVSDNQREEADWSGDGW